MAPQAVGKRKQQITYGKRSRRRSDARLDFFSNDNDEMSWYPSLDKIDHSQNPPPLPANKPTSQKAASMPAEPSDEDIRNVQEFTGMPRTDAIRYLKVGCLHNTYLRYLLSHKSKLTGLTVIGENIHRGRCRSILQ